MVQNSRIEMVPKALKAKYYSKSIGLFYKYVRIYMDGHQGVILKVKYTISI
jgi:hypothetical protein